jgi:alkanesulfonate monooxygenase SsuD/methylene tetrahydromethanopterin reductase-like flavin-dependent oxidoreductase (luciferase family)
MRMEFGILFTSHPNPDTEPFPHREVHARVTREILRADALGFDVAWIAEHHFSNAYGIMPDVFVYAGYLAALAKRIKIGAAVITLPLSNPVRVVENAAFVDLLSDGRMLLGLGSGYRAYEFDGFGVDFEARRDIQEEALPLVMDLFRKGKADHRGTHFRASIDGDYEIFPHSLQRPHPPVFLAGGTDRSIGVAGRMGLGLMLSTLTPFGELARQAGVYRRNLEEAPSAVRENPACGLVDIARWVYVAESDVEARRDSEAGLTRHLSHFFGKQTSGYLGQVSTGTGSVASGLDYDVLLESTILHGSPDTVAAKIERLREMTGLTSLMLHYPPYYGPVKALRSLELFAREVMPRFRAR